MDAACRCSAAWLDGDDLQFDIMEMADDGALNETHDRSCDINRIDNGLSLIVLMYC